MQFPVSHYNLIKCIYCQQGMSVYASTIRTSLESSQEDSSLSSWNSLLWSSS